MFLVLQELPEICKMFPFKLSSPINGIFNSAIIDGNFKWHIIVGGILSSYDNIPIDKPKSED